MLGSLCLWTGSLPVSTWLFSALVKELIVGLTSQIGLKDSKCRHSFQELWVWQEFCSNRHCHFFSWVVLWGIFASLRLPEHHWFLESWVYIFMMYKPSFYYINVKMHPKCGKHGSVWPLGRWMRFCTQCSLGKPVFQCPLFRAHGTISGLRVNHSFLMTLVLAQEDVQSMFLVSQLFSALKYFGCRTLPFGLSEGCWRNERRSRTLVHEGQESRPICLSCFLLWPF